MLRVRFTLLLSTALLACEAKISSPPAPVTPPFQLALPRQLDRHTALGLRRLDTLEYINTVRDLMFVDASAMSLPQASLVVGLSNNQHVQQVSRGDLDSYFSAADSVATQALPLMQLPQGCAPDTFTETCFDAWAPAFLERALRTGQPDAAPYRALFTSVKAEEGARVALHAVLQAVLVTPSFLYRFETPDADGHLDDWAIASRLSYLVWSSGPDDALLADARAGALVRTDGRQAALTRMLADPRAKDGAVHFVAEWLGSHGQVSKKGADVLAGLDVATLQSDLEAEQGALVNEALLAPSGSVDTLLTARFGYVSPNGARILGLPAVNSLTRVDLTGLPRRGILTSPLLVASHAKESGYSVVQLGRFTRERLLCQEIPPPPPGTDTTLPDDETTVGLGYREKLTKKTGNQPCINCHQLLNPPGFAYLNYDPLGRYLEKDSRGTAFDTTGKLTGLQQDEIPFQSLTHLIDELVVTYDVRSCFVQRSIERTFGRTFAYSDDRLYRSLTEQLMASHGNFAQFMNALVGSDELATAGPRDP